ncbi:MAG: 16S rRNA (cytosine(967)-C(5))-methyltransferase RsmB [Ruminococcus sp.]|nr:16S rRNA (cytosine(967)-C(5))-methyltransferase RsmB [Ruminococcus sp.]
MGRKTAFKVLLKIEQDDAYSNIALNNAIKERKLNHSDASLASAIVYGVLERKITLDYIIKQYSKIPLRKIELKTKIILRMGILQLLFMDKIPESAAVNESVKLAKAVKLQKSSGFINGILRNITRADVKYKLPENDIIKFLSVKYSCPEELVSLWINSYGEINCQKILEKLSGRPKIFARVNTLKTDKKSLISELESNGVKAFEVDFLNNALYLENTGSIEALKAYKEGKFHIQDASSQLCVEFLNPKPNDTMLDVCAAPGGKSFTAAQYMENTGKIFSCDMFEHKVRLIASGAKRLGIGCISATLRDALNDEVSLPVADKILCDVPCSGLGILSRKPEIRYKEDLVSKELAELQYEILCKSAKYLKKGGRLVYSTCTLNPKENNENASRFLKEHPDFYGLQLTLPTGVSRAYDENDYEITLMPHSAGTDGFYFAVFGKRD